MEEPRPALSLPGLWGTGVSEPAQACRAPEPFPFCPLPARRAPIHCLELLSTLLLPPAFPSPFPSPSYLPPPISLSTRHRSSLPSAINLSQVLPRAPKPSQTSSSASRRLGVIQQREAGARLQVDN